MYGNRKRLRLEARRKLLSVESRSSSETSSSSHTGGHGDTLPVTNKVSQGELTEDLSDRSNVPIHESTEESSNLSEVTSGDSPTPISSTSIKPQLKDWAISENVPQTSLRKLLTILSPHHPTLPLDPRTLLHSRSLSTFITVAPGTYYHFGLKTALKELCEQLNYQESVLVFDINVDGVQLFKSNVACFWVILGSVRGIKSSEFVIGLYYGMSKPASADEFLSPLIDELKDIESEHHFVPDRNVRCKLGLVLCDRPARSFVKGMKGHTGYHGCDRCHAVGEWSGSMTFKDIDCRRRTNADFRQREDAEHHIGDSPFEELSDIDMVLDFPIDMMHSICLGISKRILESLKMGPLTCKLSAHQLREIDDLLLQLRSHIPVDFSRKPRSLRHLKMWKANELYLFSVYLGFFIMPKILPANSPILKCLLTLYTVFFIMCSKHVHMDAFIESCVRDLFADLFEQTFGGSFFSYNVHSLIHLLNDYFRIRDIHVISVFRFENFLRFLKRTVRSPNQPLTQVVNRVNESDQFLGRFKYPPQDNHLSNAFYYNNEERFKVFSNDTLTLKAKSKDGFVLMKDDKIVKILYFISVDDDVKFVCKALLSYENLFTTPCSSSELKIFKAFNFSRCCYTFSISQVAMKVMVLSDSPFCCIPILHTWTD